jgi:hypothetical protein
LQDTTGRVEPARRSERHGIARPDGKPLVFDA